MTLTPAFCDSLSGLKLYSIAMALLLSLLTQARLGAQPGVVSVTPSPGVGFTQTFTLVYSDAGGYGDLGGLIVSFSCPRSGAKPSFGGLNPARKLVERRHGSWNRLPRRLVFGVVGGWR